LCQRAEETAHPRVASTLSPGPPRLSVVGHGVRRRDRDPAGQPEQEFDWLEIEHFFLIYKELEPGKSVEGAAWAGRVAAEAEVEASRRRLRATQEPGNG
jgi:hypothetical protein